jgi:hypothetical protein
LWQKLTPKSRQWQIELRKVDIYLNGDSERKYQRNFYPVAAKGVGKVGDGPGSRACRDLACLTPVLVCIGITFSSYIVAIDRFILVLLSETDNNEEGIETANCRFITFYACGNTAFQRSAA